jgi:hypothetical protein
MPPFTTVNGQTGYYYGGQFVPATQQEYDALFNTQQTQNNPYLPQSIFPESIYPQNIQPPLMGGRQDFVQQGTIKSPETATETNEQKVMQAQGDDGPILGVGNMPYVKMGNEYGVKRGKSFFGFDAMTAGGHPLNTATNTVYNTGDLTTFRKQKIANPFVAEVALIQSQNTQNALNALNNPTAPTQTQVTSPVAPTTPEITPNPTADQSGGGNWVTNMFNRQSITGVPNTTETATKVAEGTGDVIGDWGNWGFSGKEFFKSDAGKTTSAIAGAGVGLVSGLVKAGAPDKYDQRVGMSKPNLGGNLFGDATFTQVGLNPALMAATGGISALVGGGVDLVKNAVKYVKQKDRYENKKLATDTMQSIDDARENMKPDYTGYARFGTQVKNPYIKKYSPGGETTNTTYDPTTSYARPKKVVVNGKEMSTYSNEYRDLYNTGNLMSVDHEGLPNMYAPEVVVTAKMTDEERDRRLKKQSYDPNLTNRENQKKYEAKKDIQEWMKADINQPGGLQRGAEVMSFPLRAAGAGINLLGEIANTPLALMGEAISGRNDFSSALPSLNRVSNNAGLTGFAGNPDENTNQQMTPGNALFPNNPYAAFLLDLPADVLLSRGANTLFKTGSKYLPKIGKALLPTKLDSPSYVTNTFTDEIPQRYQTYRWSEKNPKTGEYDVFEEQFGIDEIPTRDPSSDSYQKVKMNSLLRQKDGLIYPITDYLRTKGLLPKESWNISDVLADPVSGRLQDGNTRYWLNKRYNPKYGLGDNKYRVESRIGTIAEREKFKPKYFSDEAVESEWVGDITSTDYKAQIEAVKARAKRMLSQEDKWVGQDNAKLREKFENAHLKHFPEGDYAPKSLGTNVGGEYTLVSKGADLSNANKARIAAHETGHYYRNTIDEAKEWNSFFDFSNLNDKKRIYLSGKSGAKNPHGSDVVQLDRFAKKPPHGDEIRERAAQLKDYIAEKKGLGPDQDFIITEADLDDAIANYVNYTGLDNSMSAMLSSLKDKKGFLNAMNKYALGLTGVGAAGVGTSELMQQQKKEYKTGGIVNPYLKKHI